MRKKPFRQTSQPSSCSSFKLEMCGCREPGVKTQAGEWSCSSWSLVLLHREWGFPMGRIAPSCGWAGSSSDCAFVNSTIFLVASEVGSVSSLVADGAGARCDDPVRSVSKTWAHPQGITDPLCPHVKNPSARPHRAAQAGKIFEEKLKIHQSSPSVQKAFTFAGV